VCVCVCVCVCVRERERERERERHLYNLVEGKQVLRHDAKQHSLSDLGARVRDVRLQIARSQYRKHEGLACGFD
jgi:hypothetical protein